MGKLAEVVNSLEYHPVNGDQEKMYKYAALREAAKAFAGEIYKRTPESREQSLAFTHLEDALMWATKSIAIRD